jgi:hypothetical protein
VVQKVKAGKSDDLAHALRSELKRSLDSAGIQLASSKQTIFVSSK